jgi:hypothetical protein
MPPGTLGRLAAIGLLAPGLSVALPLAPVPAAAIDLSGPLTGSFPAAGGPYRVIAPITVEAGQTVTLEAGCEFRFVGGSDFDVSGTLVFAGTALDPVRLVPDSSLAPPGIWEGVDVFSGGSVDLQHFHVEGAVTGLHLLGGGGVVRNGTVDFCARYGVRVDVTAATVEDLEITRAGQENAGYPGLFFGGGSATVERIRVADCAGSAVGIFTPAAPTLRDCEIVDSRSGITCVASNTRIEDCVIRGHGIPGDFNTGAGIFIGFPQGTPVVTGCTVEDNFYGVSVINDGRANLGDLTNGDITDDGGNVFRSNDDFDGTMRHVWNETAVVVSAHGNVWTDAVGVATADSATIDGWIIDDEELAMAEVDFLPLASVTGAPELPGAGPVDRAGRWSIVPNPARGPIALVAPDGGARAGAGIAAAAPGLWTAELVDVTGRRHRVWSVDPEARTSRVDAPLAAGTWFVVVRRGADVADVVRFTRLR